MVFAVLVSLADDVNGIFGLFIAGWICYMYRGAPHGVRAPRWDSAAQSVWVE